MTGQTNLMRRLARAIPALVLAGWGTAAAPAQPANRPNIVFILVDDLGSADGGCFGSRFYRTPNIDRLASSGLRFTRAYAACAVCSPTRAAIMTGKHPARLHLTDWIPGEGNPRASRFKVPEWQQQLSLSQTTLPGLLRLSGYATACIGKWHLGQTNFYPRHHGFDVSIGAGDTGQPASYFWPYGRAADAHRVPELAEQGGHSGEYLTDRLTDEALKFIDAHGRQPFFLYLAHYAVHSPLMAKEEDIEEYRQIHGVNGQSNAVYAAMVKSVDESVGRVARKLSELGLENNTIVVFTSDNGGAVHFGTPPATSNPPLRLGKGYPYEGGLRVPLIVKVPAMTHPGSTCEVPVISQDFFPTLLELAGISTAAQPKSNDGTSLVPLLKGRKTLARRELFWHYPHYWNGTGVAPYSIVLAGDWKLIRFYESDRQELYDLRHDPGEQQDLASRKGSTVRKLSARLDAWLGEVGAQRPVPRETSR